MFFNIICPSCNTKYKTNVNNIGKVVECKKCNQMLEIPNNTDKDKVVDKDCDRELQEDAVEGAEIVKKKKKKKKLNNVKVSEEYVSPEDKYWNAVGALELRRYNNRQPSVIIALLLEIFITLLTGGIVAGCGLAYMDHGYTFIKSSLFTFALYLGFIIITCGFGLALYPFWIILCLIRLVLFCILLFFI